MDIKIDDAAARALAAQAVMQAMSQVSRDALIQQAVQKLLETPKDHYGRSTGQTGIEHAFQMAMNDVAQQQVKAMLAEPGTREKLNKVIRSGLEKMLTSDKFVERVGEAFIAAFWKGGEY